MKEPFIKYIKPEFVRHSKWVNRQKESFTDQAFNDLVAEIKSTEGNVQPIKVRPLADNKDRFEVVFGHRRLQACLDLGIYVFAVVEDLSDANLFVQMDRENRNRKNLRPYEQGVMYQRALEEGLFSSNRKMGEALGVDVGGIGKLLAIARLPSAVLSAFNSPLDIKFDWGSVIAAQLVKDADLVMERASELSKAKPKPRADAIFKTLIQEEDGSQYPKEKSAVELNGKAGATAKISFDGKKLSAVLSNVSPQRRAEFEKMIQNFLDS